MNEYPNTTEFKVNKMTQYITERKIFTLPQIPRIPAIPAIPSSPATTANTACVMPQDNISTKDKTANPEKMLKLRSLQAEMFERISLEETNKKASLLDRIESKYLLSGAQYAGLLGELAGSYSVLEAYGTTVSSYVTSYYDDDGYTLYYQHHNGHSDRYKLRMRHYLSSGESYLEVKHRTNRGATLKSRINTDGIGDGEITRFLTEKFPYEISGFRPVLTTVYTRMTLVSDEGSERITFDTDLRFIGADGRSYDCGDLIIAESKHERLANTPAQKKMKELSVRKASFSKYCVGTALLNRGLKRNRFKPKLLYLSRAAGMTGNAYGIYGTDSKDSTGVCSARSAQSADSVFRRMEYPSCEVTA